MASNLAQSCFDPDSDYIHLTNHAKIRMAGRAIGKDDIDLVLTYGRASYARGAVIYAIGKKEIAENGSFLKNCDGLHVVCSTRDGAVITTYRNRSLRGLRH